MSHTDSNLPFAPGKARNRNDLTGQTFDRYSVLRFDETKNGKAYWICRCSCGQIRSVCASNLRRGLCRSCGCLTVERTIGRLTKHGLATKGGRIPEHVVWCSMINRCTNSRDPKFRHYGGRGIHVSERWSDEAEGFKNFLADMGPRPSPEHSIDRIDNDKGYESGNCRWATTAQQCRNRRNNHWLTAFGKTLCIKDWSKQTGVPRTTIHNRLRAGRSPEESLRPNRQGNPE